LSRWKIKIKDSTGGGNLFIYYFSVTPLNVVRQSWTLNISHGIEKKRQISIFPEIDNPRVDFSYISPKKKGGEGIHKILPVEKFFPPDRLNVCARGGVIGDSKKKKINLKHFFLFFPLIFSLFFSLFLLLLLFSPFCVFVLICFYDLNGL
jgi:hypothetical protein